MGITKKEKNIFIIYINNITFNNNKQVFEHSRLETPFNIYFMLNCYWHIQKVVTLSSVNW